MSALKRICVFAVCMVMVLGPVARSEGQDFSGVTVRLAQQYGMQYAPVYVMQEMGILGKHLPGATLEWTNLGGGSAMNEALISGSLDVAFMGIPPMVIAWDKGVSYRIAAGICVPPAELVVRDEGIKSLKDFTPEHKIALPSVGSIQHILLSMAAEKELGDPHALDNMIVAMANPDAFGALTSGTEVAAHFASMPYIDLEHKQGMHSILDGKQAFDEQASIICVTSKALHENEAVYQGLMTALSEAVDVINAQGDQVLEVIAQAEKITVDDAKAYLNWPGTVYSTEVYGLQGLSDFMQRSGYTGKTLGSYEDICWPGARMAQ